MSHETDVAHQGHAVGFVFRWGDRQVPEHEPNPMACQQFAHDHLCYLLEIL
jgi:hypothetical protein